MTLTDSVLTWIAANEDACGMSETYHVATFKGFRGNDSMWIEVYDSGPTVANRYRVTVRNLDTEAETTSSAQPTVEQALQAANWDAVG